MNTRLLGLQFGLIKSGYSFLPRVGQLAKSLAPVVQTAGRYLRNPRTAEMSKQIGDATIAGNGLASATKDIVENNYWENPFKSNPELGALNYLPGARLVKNVGDRAQGMINSKTEAARSAEDLQTAQARWDREGNDPLRRAERLYSMANRTPAPIITMTNPRTGVSTTSGNQPTPQMAQTPLNLRK